jgi:YD repeat-containing protein
MEYSVRTGDQLTIDQSANAQSNKRILEYDLQSDMLTSIRWVDSAEKISFGYNRDKLMEYLIHTDMNSATTRWDFLYDTDGKVSRITSGGTEDITLSYDSLGRISVLSARDLGSATIQRDAKNQMVDVTTLPADKKTQILEKLALAFRWVKYTND